MKMTYTRFQPLREVGPFAIETFAKVKVYDLINSSVERSDYAVVYADNDKPSNCVWFVPNTWENIFND